MFEGQYLKKTAGDTHLVTMEHLQEMATVESIGHMADDVTWSPKCQGREWPRYRKMQIYRKRWEIEAQ